MKSRNKLLWDRINAATNVFYLLHSRHENTLIIGILIMYKTDFFGEGIKHGIARRILQNMPTNKNCCCWRIAVFIKFRG